MAGPGADGDLLDVLEAAASGRGRVRFVPDHAEPMPFAELWARSARSARWLSRVPAGGSVAMVLASTPDAVAALVGGWRAGLAVASLPTPARAMRADDYQRQVERICVLTGAELLLVEDALVPLLPPLPVPVTGFGACAADRGGRVDGRGEFVQFTSGSTAAPKGVRLTLDAIAANVAAVLDVLAPVPGDLACSWLPLSHDMGLIGMLLCSWAATRPDVVGDAEVCLIRPEQFLRAPAQWLETCSRLGATVTAAPDFGFALARRTLPAAGRLDLSQLRACVCGGDTVRPATLAGFAADTAAAGFRGDALCPAYGLAEATLAVTMVRPGEPWRARELDAAALAEGEWQDAEPGRGRPVVSAGTPVPGMRVRTVPRPDGGPTAAGAVEVAGPSLLSEYVGAATPVTADGWLRTGDLGMVVDGELYPLGRADDRLKVAGRTFYAAELEDEAAAAIGARPGTVAAVDGGNGDYVLVAETAQAAAEAGRTARLARDALVTRFGLGPSAVILTPRGALPKTPSGKQQRHRLRHELDAGSLERVATVPFRGGGR